MVHQPLLAFDYVTKSLTSRIECIHGMTYCYNRRPTALNNRNVGLETLSSPRGRPYFSSVLLTSKPDLRVLRIFLQSSTLAFLGRRGKKTKVFKSWNVAI